jgi:two-component system, OmpR family, sensor histidine kinase VicK
LQVLTLISDREVTQVWEGIENTVGKSLDVLYKLRKSCDLCVDRNAPSVILTTEPIRQAYFDLKRRGIRVRLITEVTRENIEYCREMMKIAEVRHMDGISGNFTIADGTDYAGVATTQEAQPITQLLVSNVRAFVEQQQYFFEMLWRKAVSSEDRIKELEEGVEPEFLEVIRDGEIAADVYRKLALSVEREALLILPSAKALVREYELGILSILAEGGVNNNAVVVKIICPLDESNKDVVDWLMKKAPAIQILQAGTSESTILIVDGRKLFRAELRESDADRFPNAIGFALYSNSRPTINSFRSFFELLWNATIMNEKLKEAHRMQQDFINVAAHELRTPIQVILGMAEMIESALAGNKRGSVNTEDVRMIARNARRLERLMEDILDIARIESRSLQLTKSQFNLKDIILPLADDFRKHIHSLPSEDKNVQIIAVSQAEKDITLHADRERITQVLSNLLTNAVKFTDSGTISIKVERTEGEHVSISVTDTGSGIDPTIMPRLFSKFATKSDKGTGLGLYSSKAIVEAHGGKIWAENNNDGMGATFTFTLPTTIGGTAKHNLDEKEMR